jgi:formylglycine-generating enzyme required for sulfatase activity
MMTKRIILGVLLAAMIVIICSCKKDNAPGPASQAQPAPAVNPLPSNPQQGTVLENSIGMKLVWIPPGEFEMGSDHDDLDEKPVHHVRIPKAFYMSVTEVTQGQYKAVMDSSPWSGQTYVQESSENPAVYVSWDDAVEFCTRLSEKEGRTYRLPTEAEWEYACRADTRTAYSFGDSESMLGDYAWFDGNAWNVNQRYAHRVAQKKPNVWGLYDMHGNIWEWCSDWYDEDYYSKSPASDPQGPSSGESRVLRGGSWFSYPWFCHSADRLRRSPDGRYYDLGFRVVVLDFQK